MSRVVLGEELREDIAVDEYGDVAYNRHDGWQEEWEVFVEVQHRIKYYFIQQLDEIIY